MQVAVMVISKHSKNGWHIYYVITEDKHAIEKALKYTCVKHNLPKPLPQIYIWKKNRGGEADHPACYEFPALQGESG